MSKSGMELEQALEIMRHTTGWFTDAEGTLMFNVVSKALSSGLKGQVVEVGSYCGRSTVILGSAVQKAHSGTRVLAVDPHEGGLSIPKSGNSHVSPTLSKFRETIKGAGLQSVVQEVLKKSSDVKVSGPIAVLFIDGLHDYENVSKDYEHFAPHLVDEAVVMFHDYGNPDFPDVARFVESLLVGGTLFKKEVAFHLCVTRRTKK